MTGRSPSTVDVPRWWAPVLVVICALTQLSYPTTYGWLYPGDGRGGFRAGLPGHGVFDLPDQRVVPEPGAFAHQRPQCRGFQKGHFHVQVEGDHGTPRIFVPVVSVATILP